MFNGDRLAFDVDTRIHRVLTLWFGNRRYMSTKSSKAQSRRVDGYWVLAPETPPSELDQELDCCRTLQIAVQDCTEPTPFHVQGVVRSLRFPRQARLHPTKYLAGLASALQRRGSRSTPSRHFIALTRSPRRSRPARLWMRSIGIHWIHYHYVRLKPLSTDEEIVIVGGEDHKSGEADDGAQRFVALERWARDRLPNLGEITH